MTLIIDIKDSVADKILYFLNHFKDDIKIIKKDEDIDLSDREILDNFKEGLQDLKTMQEDPAVNSKRMEDFLDEL